MFTLEFYSLGSNHWYAFSKSGIMSKSIPSISCPVWIVGMYTHRACLVRSSGTLSTKGHSSSNSEFDRKQPGAKMNKARSIAGKPVFLS